MEIDPHQLPEDPGGLAADGGRVCWRSVESQEQRLRQVQHWVEQLLRARYGPRRERVNENQLFLFAVRPGQRHRRLRRARLVGGSQRSARTGSTPRPRDMAGSGCRRRWSGGEWSTIWRSQERQCPDSARGS